MSDQVNALRGKGVAAAALNSHQDDDEQHEVVVHFLRGELELLYVSPERAALARAATRSRQAGSQLRPSGSGWPTDCKRTDKGSSASITAQLP